MLLISEIKFQNLSSDINEAKEQILTEVERIVYCLEDYYTELDPCFKLKIVEIDLSKTTEFYNNQWEVKVILHITSFLAHIDLCIAGVEWNYLYFTDQQTKLDYPY